MSHKQQLEGNGKNIGESLCNALQDMDALVCRRTLTGHRHSVLCITGMDLVGQKHRGQEEDSLANGSNGISERPLLVSQFESRGRPYTCFHNHSNTPSFQAYKYPFDCLTPTQEWRF